MSCDEDNESGACQDLMTERIRYFTGRHMTARDFRDGDAYHRSYRHLHNRILHGWGIACGLDVRLHPRPECRPDRVVIGCGMALDCCGREIVVRRDVVAAPMPWAERPKTADNVTPDPAYVLLLCLQYTETPTEKVPVLYSRKACSDPTMEDGRIREGYRLCWRWVRREDLGTYGWHTPDTCAPADDPPPYPRPGPEHPAEPPHEEPGCCLDPECPLDHCVPLAVIVAPRREEMDDQEDIDTSGRRSIVQAREHLTHVCWTSWTHGGVVRSRDLDTLKVRFDRPLAVESPSATDPGPRGINERTFVVQWGEQDEDLDFVEYRRPPYLTSDHRTAVYEIHDSPRKLEGHVIHVTLRCDFIVDGYGNPVDGDHLRGRLPTGNGLPGGTFESWFTVVSDADYDQYMQQGVAKQDAPAKEG